MSGYPQLLRREEPSPTWPATPEFVFVYKPSQETFRVLLRWTCQCSVESQHVRRKNQTAWSNVFSFLDDSLAVKPRPEYYWQSACQIPCEDLRRHHPVIYRQNSVALSGSSPWDYSPGRARVQQSQIKKGGAAIQAVTQVQMIAQMVYSLWGSAHMY